MGRLFQYASPGDGSLYVVGVFSGALTGIARGFFGLLMMRSVTALAFIPKRDCSAAGVASGALLGARGASSASIRCVK